MSLQIKTILLLLTMPLGSAHAEQIGYMQIGSWKYTEIVDAMSDVKTVTATSSGNAGELKIMCFKSIITISFDYSKGSDLGDAIYQSMEYRFDKNTSNKISVMVDNRYDLAYFEYKKEQDVFLKNIRGSSTMLTRIYDKNNHKIDNTFRINDTAKVIDKIVLECNHLGS